MLTIISQNEKVSDLETNNRYRILYSFFSNVLATERHIIRLAPRSFIALEQTERLAPVVTTSSIITTVRPSTQNFLLGVKDFLAFFNLSSLVKNAIEDFAPVVGSVLESGITPDTVGKTAKALKSFWGSQAQSIYSTMNKESVENITELISKL